MTSLQLAKLTAWAIFFCAILVVFCYMFVDAPVAFWVERNFTREGKWIEPETDVVPYVIFGAPFVVVALLLWRRSRKCQHWHLAVVAAMINLLATALIKLGLKWMF